MANDLTGDFDVVVEFSLQAANRVLAAMHANERFLHSVSLRVDDNQPPGKGQFPRPSVGGTLDAFGEPVANHKQIGQLGLLPAQVTASNPLVSVLNPVVNANTIVIFEPPVVPSHLQGRAQLQLSPPTIDVPDASGTRIRSRIEVMARYLPDPQTAPAAEFVRGELQITAPVNMFSSNAARVVEIDIRSSAVVAQFTPVFSSNPLSAQDLSGINQLISNALKTSFLPANASLPSKVTDLQIKTMTGSLNALAILLNMTPLLGSTSASTPQGHPGTVQNIFLGNSDDFAFAIGRDYVQAAFPNVTDHRFPTLAGYTFSVTGPQLQFQNGQMLMVANGHAHNPSDWYPDFDFTVTQALILQLAATTPGGPLDTAIVVPNGDISLGINGVPDFIVNLFDGSLLDNLRQKRDSSLQTINQSVRDAFDADKNLGQFLRSLLNPAVNSNIRDHRRVSIQLAYTSVQIQPSGVILYGSLTVPAWASPHVEFEEVPVNHSDRLTSGSVIIGGPDYSAFKTWIPGGFIGRYEWAYQGQTPPFVDANKFVLVRPPVDVSTFGSASVAPISSSSNLVPPGVASTGIASGFSPLCVTVRGTRIPTSGSGSLESVNATSCFIGSFPVISGVLAENSPVIALTQPDVQGNVVVIGHSPASPNAGVANSPNLIVHFADDTTAGHLESLIQGLLNSKRKDAATAVLAVLTPTQLSKVRHLRDVIYSDHAAWEQLYNATSAKKPLTLIVSPKGKIVWQHSGPLDPAYLAAELKRVLTPGLAVATGVLRLGLRVESAPPNFLFEYAPGREMTLSKLTGRPVVIIFWRSTSKPSIEAVYDVQRAGEKSDGSGTVVLAVNDGESREIAQKAAVAGKFSAILVTDPSRAISRAYGVNLWPTMVFIDAEGIVRQVRYGRVSPSPSVSRTTEENSSQPIK
jgi:peroxiredoxin